MVRNANLRTASTTPAPVVTAVVEHLISVGVARLVATVTVGNAASARVLTKSGFAFTRVIPENDVIRGVLYDDEEYIRIAHPAQPPSSPGH